MSPEDKEKLRELLRLHGSYTVSWEILEWMKDELIPDLQKKGQVIVAHRMEVAMKHMAYSAHLMLI